ncbi:hypothetical protein Pcac1_g27107 [Phytophthora cactorum]|nr:hypothetical protein Pcac1_g27107 [Phytophthora cactorum]
MKFNTFLVAVMAVLGAVAAADQPVAKTPVEALEKAQASTLPDGVTLTGVTERRSIRLPVPLQPLQRKPTRAMTTMIRTTTTTRTTTRNNTDGVSVEVLVVLVVLAAGDLAAGVAGAVGVAMDPTASGSCAVASPAGRIRWATGTCTVQVYTAAGAVLVFLWVASTTASLARCGGS